MMKKLILTVGVAVASALLGEIANLPLQVPCGELTDFIRQIRDQFDLTIFMIEHHMDLVMEISDRIYVLDFGTTIASGDPTAIQNNERVIKAYLGEDEDA